MKVEQLARLLENSTLYIDTYETPNLEARVFSHLVFDKEDEAKIFQYINEISKDNLTSILGSPSGREDRMPVWDIRFPEMTTLSVRSYQSNPTHWVILGATYRATSLKYAEILKRFIQEEYQKIIRKDFPAKFKPLNKRIDLD